MQNYIIQYIINQWDFAWSIGDCCCWFDKNKRLNKVAVCVFLDVLWSADKCIRGGGEEHAVVLMTSNCCTSVEACGADCRVKQAVSGVGIFSNLRQRLTWLQCKIPCWTQGLREEGKKWVLTQISLELWTSSHPSLLTTSNPFLTCVSINYKSWSYLWKDA